MPLVRYQIGNEFRLGHPKLSLEADAEDPKAVLDGVAVSGLIGILRQLGDLANFAAEVFHDLEEEVSAIVSRSHKVETRVQRIESALASIEKAVMAQTSHIHFAYIAGVGWHSDIPNGQNNLSQSDLPQFLMDSYEHCRSPPHLFLLDRFDTGGAGACLKRYSDPSFFKTAGDNLELVRADKVQWEKKPYKIKRKGQRQKNGAVRHAVLLSGYHNRMQLGYLNTGGQSIVAELKSTSDMQSALQFSSRSKSLDSKPRSDCTERVSDVNSYTGSEELKCNDLPSSSNGRMQDHESPTLLSDDRRVEGSENHSQGQVSSEPSSISWDEKIEIVKSTTQPFIYIPEDQGQDAAPLPAVFDQSELEQDVATNANSDQEDILFDFDNIEMPFSSTKQFDETEKVRLGNQLCVTIPEDQLLDLDPLSVNIGQKLEKVTDSLSADHENLFHVDDVPAPFSSERQIGERDMVKPTSQSCRTNPGDQDQDPARPVFFDKLKLDQNAGSLANADREDILFDFEHKSASLACDSKSDVVKKVKPTHQLCPNIIEEQFQVLEPVSTTFHQSKLEQDAASPVKSFQDVSIQVEAMPLSFSDKNQVDEAEILRPTSQSCTKAADDRFDDVEWEKDSLNFVNVTQENTFLNIKNIPLSFASKIHLGEANTLMGALNLKEPEAEMLLECQAKEEVELCKPAAADCSQALEPLPATVNQPNLGKDSSGFVNEDQESALFNVKDMPELLLKNKFDRIGSETESFLDALESEESEVKTGFECKAKQEQELCKNDQEHCYQDLEQPLPRIDNQQKWEKDSGDPINEHQENSLLHVKGIPAPCPGQNKFDGISSETSSFMNAFNLKKSEVQTDSGCKTKKEVELCKNVNEDCYQDLGPFPAIINQPEWEKDSVGSVDEHQENLSFHVKYIPASCPGENEFGGISSETASFLDALNSKKSESETDLECKAKQEVELCESVDEDCCHDLQPLPLICEQPKWEKISENFAVLDQENAFFNVKNTLASWPSAIQLDDFSHETDKLMDALKSKESEVETDLECQGIDEVKLQDTFKHQEMENIVFEVHEVVAQSFRSSNIDRPVTSFSPNEVSPNASASAENLSHSQLPPVTTEASSLACSFNASLDGSLDVFELPQTKVSESISGSTSSNSNFDQTNKLTGDKIEIQESFVPPIKLWTNGGLLGLEPSKPPVFDVSDVSSQNYNTNLKGATDVLLSSSALPKMQHDLSSGKSDALDEPVKPLNPKSSSLLEKNELPYINNSSDLVGICPGRSVGAVDVVEPVSLLEYSNLSCDKQDNCIPMKPFSQEFALAASEIRPEKVKDSHTINGCGMETPKDDIHAISCNDFRSNKYVQNSTAISTGVVGIGRRLLVNSFWRKPLPVHENSNVSSSVVCSDAMKLQRSTNCDEQENKQNGVVSETAFDKEAKLGLECTFSANSYQFDCPSPPLDHMKISFHATDGLETSKLALQFRDLHDLQGSVDDAFFPLFQLLPEATCNLQDMGSESDDGTFYRSPPYLSEDLLSACSESNSEEWESNGAAEGQDYEMYDALCRSSSTTSISCPYKLEAITHCNSNPYCGFGCLNAEDSIKSFDHLNTSLLDYFMNQQDGKHSINRMPQSLPELQWTITKPTFALLEDREDTVCEVFKDPDSRQIQKFISQHPKRFADPHIEETTLFANGKMIQHGSRELNESAKIVELD